MKYQIQAIKKILIVLLINMILIFEFNFVLATETIEVEPTENQFLELRAVSVTDTDHQNKQVLMELWGNDVEFKGFDVRFAYDSTKLNPSNIETNEITSNSNQYFKFEQEFSNSLNMFTVPINGTETGIRAVVSFKPPVTESEHIIEKEGIGKVVNTNGSVLLGKMSFQMTADLFDTSYFHLIEDENTSPVTGIKININGTNNFQNQSSFRFTDKTASKNAYLESLKVSSGKIDNENTENSTYKEYKLSPEFSKEHLEYGLTLMEYIDSLDITVSRSDQKSSMKIKFPKRDENNELQYEENGTTIIYDEKEIIDNEALEITLNKLGEPDTLVEIIVTAEDGKTINNYKINIHRPCGKVTGKVILGGTGDGNLQDSMLGSYGIELKHIADISFYKAGEFNWDGLVDGTYSSDFSMLDDYEILQSGKSNDEGIFEVYLIPGAYDCLLERKGFLADVTKSITINDEDVIDLGEKSILEGDVDRNGYIDVGDVTDVISFSGSADGDGMYDAKYDFGQKGYVSIDDIVSTIGYMYNIMTISTY